MEFISIYLFVLRASLILH